jgi:hypothetical protein
MAQRTKRMTQFARTMQFFRTAEIDEATAALAKAITILSIREEEAYKPRRTRRLAEVDALAKEAANG